MKKHFLLSALLLICTFPIFAHDFEVDGIYYNRLGGDSVEVTYQGDSFLEYDEYSNTIEIPSTVAYNSTSYRVTTIGDYAFSYSSLTAITIPNSVTTISNYAFEGCYSLSIPIYTQDTFILMPSIYSGAYTIPDGIKTIASNAFAYCSDLTSVTIPNSVTTIGNSAFISCSKLTGITIPTSVTSIGNSAFSNCSGLTSITVPNSVISMGEYAFYFCSGLTEITLSAGVKSIETGTFQSCYKLMEITIPEGVTSIGIDAFQGCSALTKVILPESVSTIDNFAFSGCYRLEEITLPTNMISIGKRAFYNCASLTQVTLPEGITTISEYMFYECGGLAAITIPQSVTSIENGAFYYCSKLTEINIPKGVTTIGESAFQDCTNLIKITCEAVTPPTLGNDRVFQNVSAVAYVCYESEEAYKNAPYWSELDIQIIKDFELNGIYYKHIGSDSIAVIYKGKSSENYENEYSGVVNIPATVEKNSAIYHVTVISDSAFYNCSNLTEIKIPNSVIEMGESAFDGCTKMRSLQIGNGLTEYPEKAFANCTGLLNLTVLAETPPYVQANTFENVSRSLLVHVPCSALDYYKAVYYWNEFTNYQEGMVYSFSATSAQKTQGKVTIHQRPDCESDGVAIFEAVPYKGYEFVGWNDGSIEPYRIVEVTENVEYIASFISTSAGDKTEDVVVNPSDNSAEFIWPAIEGANTYVFVIYADEEHTDKICTLTCNKYGQLTNVDFSRNKPAAHQEEPSGLLNFTITGLESATTYGYALNSYDSTDTLIKSDVGLFRTTGTATSVETPYIASSDNVRKIFENGTIYIIRNGEKYTVDGRKVI